MAKWADYLISAVRYSNSLSGRYISHLRVHKDNGDSAGTEESWTKSEVVASINIGNSFITVYKNLNNQWTRGEDIRVVVINNQSYLRTDANNISKDNLENLPEF
jgi:hypothetical protein